MRTPTLEGMIERRLLINFRVDPQVAASLVPEPFRPQIVRGQAVAGICLLRLGELRPVAFPRFVGQRSENVAHRIAVEWDGDGGVQQGVYINRRDSDALLNVIAGGRVFPGVHHRATFTVDETADGLAIDVRSNDGTSSVKVRAQIDSELVGSRLFDSIEEASLFFERGSLGFSDGMHPGDLEAMVLSTNAWQVEPLHVEHVRSSYFENPDLFPAGTATLDCGLVMRRVPVTWRGGPTLRRRALLHATE